jgi:hypothetical protein
MFSRWMRDLGSSQCACSGRSYRTVIWNRRGIASWNEPFQIVSQWTKRRNPLVHRHALSRDASTRGNKFRCRLKICVLLDIGYIWIYYTCRIRWVSNLYSLKFVTVCYGLLEIVEVQGWNCLLNPFSFTNMCWIKQMSKRFRRSQGAQEDKNVLLA